MPTIIQNLMRTTLCPSFFDENKNHTALLTILLHDASFPNDIPMALKLIIHDSIDSILHQLS